MADARCLIFVEVNKILELIFSLIPYVECNSIRSSIKDNLISEIPSNEKFISFPATLSFSRCGSRLRRIYGCDDGFSTEKEARLFFYRNRYKIDIPQDSILNLPSLNQ